ncbi:N-acetylmuramoyl-L-alanine amidase [Candidatus Profftia tarda]|uniref:N-acetylmuramoyl-L-alanine amidase n=1 Tax=Candidatus Profftia tarda TaxID=1177216 RepID=A0A8E4F1Z9_9ENTR|nr:N-acetylmuramoyl-L-alanine amidase [Candidatus Profftia tarda]CAD6511423.1 N-acetylmuramoyl-L-alanine amidase AmiB [Candidatus Profftia tarda]
MSKLICTAIWLGVAGLLLPKIGNAAQIINIHVLNEENIARIRLTFNGPPKYNYSLLANLHKMIVNINNTKKNIRGLPITFTGKNILRSIHLAHILKHNNVQLIFDLNHKTKVISSYQRNSVLFIIKNYAPIAKKNDSLHESHISSTHHSKIRTLGITTKQRSRLFDSTKLTIITKNKNRGIISKLRRSYHDNHRIVVAIDAGHGGEDPGAIGHDGLYEKHVTLAIAKRLKNLMKTDRIFQPVLIRTGDYFLSVMGRSETARKQQANLLISIHSDAAPNRRASGSSVWLLSDRRANNEMASWLSKHSKKYELLGGAGHVLTKNSHDKYFSHAVLDLQFVHSQRVGSEIAMQIIQQLKSIGNLHKRHPEHASLGILSSLDIPSLLIETGFISNIGEERLLGSAVYQEKIAKAIYTGVRNYFVAHLHQSSYKIYKRAKI